MAGIYLYRLLQCLPGYGIIPNFRVESTFQFPQPDSREHGSLLHGTMGLIRAVGYHLLKNGRVMVVGNDSLASFFFYLNRGTVFSRWDLPYSGALSPGCS